MVSDRGPVRAALAVLVLTLVACSQIGTDPEIQVARGIMKITRDAYNKANQVAAARLASGQVDQNTWDTVYVQAGGDFQAAISEAYTGLSSWARVGPAGRRAYLAAWRKIRAAAPAFRNSIKDPEFQGILDSWSETTKDYIP